MGDWLTVLVSGLHSIQPHRTCPANTNSEDRIMPKRPLISEQNGKTSIMHNAIKWFLTLATGAVAFGLVLVLNGQL